MSDLRNVHLYNFGGGLTEWGKNIRRLRIIKNTDLIKMAEHLGVPVGYLSGVECGRKTQDPEFMKRCEDYLESLPDNGDRVKIVKRAESNLKELSVLLEQTPKEKEEFKRQYLGDWRIDDAPKRNRNKRSNNEATRMTSEEQKRFDESFEKTFRHGDKYF